MTEIGLPGGNAVAMALETLSVARVQMLMSSSRRSDSEIAPSATLESMLVDSASAPDRISALAAGVITSEIEIVTPDRVAQWKPSSLSRSSV